MVGVNRSNQIIGSKTYCSLLGLVEIKASNLNKNCGGECGETLIFVGNVFKPLLGVEVSYAYGIGVYSS